MDKFEVKFGSTLVSCTTFQITNAINTMPTATLKVTADNFKAAGSFNYLDDVLIERIEPKQRMFAGNVVSVKSGSDSIVTIKLEGGIEFSDTYMAGLTVINIQTPELVYSMARTAGVPDSRLAIEGLDKSMKGMVAFIPFNGLEIKQKEILGNFQLLNLANIKDKLPQGQDSEIWHQFMRAEGWLCFPFSAPHFADAEKIAIEKADSFLTMHTATLQYGYSEFNNNIVNWERTRQPLNLKRTDHVLLITQSSGSLWLRDTTAYQPAQTQIVPNVDLDINSVLSADEFIQLPLLVWNRFRDSGDYHVVTVGFWQVIELLSAGVKLPKRFNKTQLNELKDRVVSGLGENEASAVKPVLEHLNKQTLTDKLDKHLKNIGMSLNLDDQECLEAFRKIRNAIEHGRKPTEPSQQELKRLKVLLNKILIMSFKRTTSK